MGQDVVGCRKYDASVRSIKEIVAGKVKALVETGVARGSRDYDRLDQVVPPDYSKLDDPQLVGLACSLLVRADAMSRSNVDTEEVIARAAACALVEELRRRGLEQAVAKSLAYDQLDRASSRHPLTWEGYF